MSTNRKDAKVTTLRVAKIENRVVTLASLLLIFKIPLKNRKFLKNRDFENNES